MENENTLFSELDHPVYILDSYGLIYRAYFALVNHPLTNKNGDNISALVIFFKNLRALLSKYKPTFLAAAFDSRTKTFRHEFFPEYKATRQKTPEDLHAQIPWIEEALTELGIPVLRCDGFEADDIIALVAKKCAEEGRPCRILSGDKDLLQLVNGNCMEMQPDKANGGWETFGPKEVEEKWGIPPEKILDYLSLVGDSADNVPGVKGIGDKTALKLLTEYGSLDEIISLAKEGKIPGAAGKKLKDGAEDAEKSRKLIRLNTEVPVEIDFESFRTDNLDYGKAASCLSKYGAIQVAKSYGTVPTDPEPENSVAEKGPDEKKIPEIKKNEGDYKPCCELSELKSYIEGILSSTEKRVAFDTETDSLDTHTASLVGFSLSNRPGSGIYVPVILPGGMFAEPTISKKDAVSELKKLFTDPDVTVIMHNGKFDIEVLSANGMDEKIRCRIFDTMVAAWLLEPSSNGKAPYSLEFLAEKELHLKGTEFSEIVGKGQTFADVPLDKAYRYGAEDSDFTFQLHEAYRKRIEDKGFSEIFHGMEMKILPILAEMETNGIHLDKKALADYSKELSASIAELEKKIHSTAGHEFNIASPKQLQTVLFEERGLKAGKKTKTGYSTDTEVLEELSLGDDPLPQMILDYRAKTKLLSTYVDALPLMAGKDGKVRTSFMQTGTATGRLSSKDPNLQNIPVRDDAGRKIRTAFTSTEGKVFISADYAQIELVVLAHLSGDEHLCRAFNEGTDVHRSTAALVFGVAPEDVTADQRRMAKVVNFGVIYGMSPFRLAKDLGISRTEAKDFIDRYFANYAGVRKFLDDTIASAKEKGCVETITGRKRAVPEIQNKNKLIAQSGERIAVNTPVQGSAADIVKFAMIKVHDALEKQAKGVRMLLQVHDELIFECPDDNQTIEETIGIIRREMESAYTLRVPLRVSIESGRNWGEFH